MSKVIAFMAQGFEEVECLAVVDVLRRAGVEVTTVSITDNIAVTGSHNITVIADEPFDEDVCKDADLLFLPGGMPGTTNLAAHEGVKKAITNFLAEEKRIAAICAAPSVFGEMGILKGKKATCYPGFEGKLLGACHCQEGVVTDGNITTGRGLGYALDLGLEIVALLVSPEKAAEVKKAIQYDK